MRARLERILADAQEMAKQQAALTASKQEATKRLKGLITEGQRMATGVDKFLKEHYGLRRDGVGFSRTAPADPARSRLLQGRVSFSTAILRAPGQLSGGISSAD